MAGLLSSREDPLQELLERLRPLTEADRAAALAALPALDPDLHAQLLRHLAPGARRYKAPSASALAAGIRFGAFEVQDLIGRGGMAEVYRVRRIADGEPHSAVLKLLSREVATHAEAFDRERRRLATLDHRHIAQLFDGGISEDGLPYLVMEYVDGSELFCHLRDHGLDLSQRLRLFVQICDAVDCAHRNRIVHGDIKPSNIRVTPDGVAKLLDFGMAAAGRDHGELRSILSPAYSAPEQLLGEAASEASDVFSLGAILYQMLAGVPPVERRGEAGTDAAALRARETPQRPPSVAAASHAHPPVAAERIRGDLDAIVGKAMQRDPSSRYASVAALQADLRSYEARTPIEARRGERLYRLRIWLNRHRLSTAIGALLVAVATVGFSIA